MEARNTDKQREKLRTSYIEGNTVRKLNAIPEIQREEEDYAAPSKRRQEHRQTKTLSGVSLSSLLVLSAAIIVTLFVCVEYLKLRSDVTQMNKQITTKKQELSVLTKDNDAAFEKINKAVNLDKVYKYAVEKLGMVYPNKNLVIKYHSNEDDYVIKYQEIPD